MELTGIEPVSALAICTPFIHRFSLSSPQGGSRQLFLTMGFSGEVLASQPPEDFG